MHTRITVTVTAIAIAVALAGCAPSATTRNAGNDHIFADNPEPGAKAEADYYRSVERQRDQETRRIVREELERQAPRGLRP